MSSQVKTLPADDAISSDDVVDSSDVLMVVASHDSWLMVFTVYGLVTHGGHGTRRAYFLILRSSSSATAAFLPSLVL